MLVKRNYSEAAFRRPQVGPLMAGGNFYSRDSRKRQSRMTVRRSQRGYLRTGGSYGRYSRAGGSGPEWKAFDATTLSLTSPLTMVIGSTAATGQLCFIAQGDDVGNRTGRKIVVRSILVNLNCVWAPAAGATAGQIVYGYLIQDKQCNGAVAAITDVFTSALAGFGAMNLDNSHRFKVLKKWVIQFTSPAGVTGAYNAVTKPMHFYKRCNIPLMFSGTTGALTNIRSNNLFMVVGATGSPTTDLSTITGTVRLRFTDD